MLKLFVSTASEYLINYANSYYFIINIIYISMKEASHVLFLSISLL